MTGQWLGDLGSQPGQRGAQGANHVILCLQSGEGVHREAKLGLGHPQGTGKAKWVLITLTQSGNTWLRAHSCALKTGWCLPGLRLEDRGTTQWLRIPAGSEEHRAGAEAQVEAEEGVLFLWDFL